MANGVSTSSNVLVVADEAAAFAIWIHQIAVTFIGHTPEACADTLDARLTTQGSGNPGGKDGANRVARIDQRELPNLLSPQHVAGRKPLLELIAHDVLDYGDPLVPVRAAAGQIGRTGDDSQ